LKYTAFSADGGPSNESRNFLLSVFNPGRTGSFGPLHAAGADQLGMLFINRRVAPEGATMPAPKP